LVRIRFEMVIRRGDGKIAGRRQKVCAMIEIGEQRGGPEVVGRCPLCCNQPVQEAGPRIARYEKHRPDAAEGPAWRIGRLAR
jgi:hypothetical protein